MGGITSLQLLELKVREVPDNRKNRRRGHREHKAITRMDLLQISQAGRVALEEARTNPRYEHLIATVQKQA